MFVYKRDLSAFNHVPASQIFWGDNIWKDCKPELVFFISFRQQAPFSCVYHSKTVFCIIILKNNYIYILMYLKMRKIYAFLCKKIFNCGNVAVQIAIQITQT